MGFIYIRTHTHVSIQASTHTQRSLCSPNHGNQPHSSRVSWSGLPSYKHVWNHKLDRPEKQEHSHQTKPLLIMKHSYKNPSIQTEKKVQLPSCSDKADNGSGNQLRCINSQNCCCIASFNNANLASHFRFYMKPYNNHRWHANNESSITQRKISLLSDRSVIAWEILSSQLSINCVLDVTQKWNENRFNKPLLTYCNSTEL